MAHLIAPELYQEFAEAVRASCPPERVGAAETLRAHLEREDPQQSGDPSETETKLRVRLEQDPTDLETLCALDRLHGDCTSLIEILRQRCDLAVDYDEQWALLVRIGLLHIVTGSEDGVRSVIDLLQPRPAAGAN